MKLLIIAWSIALFCGRAFGMPAPMIGVNLHLGGSNPDRVFGMVRGLGADSMRRDLQWSAVERTPHVYRIPAGEMELIDYCQRNSIKPLLVLDYGNKLYGSGGMPKTPAEISAFAEYARFVATTLRGKVTMYEVWNEWNNGAGNNGRGKGSAQDYARLLRATYAALKSVDPKITVLGGAVSGWDKAWIVELLKSGGGDYMDALSVHPYTYGSGELGSTPENGMAWLDGVEAELARYRNRPFPIYVTEIGWPTYLGLHSTPADLSAGYLGRTFLLAQSRGYLKGVWWYEFKDAGTNITDKEQNFGLLNANLERKPQFDSMNDVVHLIRDSVALSRVSLYAKGASLYDCYDGRAHRYVAWSIRPQRITLRSSAPVTVRTLGSSERRGAPRAGTLTLAPVPVVIESRTPILFGN